METLIVDTASSPPSASSQRPSEMGSSSVPNPFNRNIDDAHDYDLGDEEDEWMTPETTQRSKRKQPSADPSSGQTNAKRILPTRSGVWDHFTRLPNNRDKCICTYCKKQYSCPTKSGTTNLKNHLKSCKEHKAWLDGRDPAESQQVINSQGSLSSGKVSERVFREAVNEMIVIAELPLSFIEHVAFKHFCEKCKLYTPMSRRTAKRDIVKMYVERKAAYKKWFVASKQRVSLTTDIWVSQVTGDSYMVVTAHYVDCYWRLNKLIIGFIYVTDHKGPTIAASLLQCLADWGIERVFSVTVDNATANSNALRKVESSLRLLANDSILMDGAYMHMRCAAHIINLIVKDGMAEVNASVIAIRNAVSYVRSGTNRLKSFELKVDSGRLTRGSLPLDVKTRWNSTLLMLTKAIEYKVAFQKMEAEDKLYTDHFNDYEKGEKRIGPPLLSDWHAVERLVKFLNIFYNATLVVSASTYVNAHKCYGQIVNIATNLQHLCHSFDPELKKKALDMFKKFEKYWDGLKNINRMLVVASVFDPRKKMQFAKMCFEELYGEGSTEAAESYDSTINLMRDMFKDYSERFNKAAGPQQSQSSQSQCQSTISSQSSQQSNRMDFVGDELGIRNIEKMYNTKLKEIGVRDTRNELDVYLKEEVENPDVMIGTEYDVLSFWKLNNGKFPILSEMARDLFAMQVSSVAAESAFSTSGRIIDPYRSCLTHFMVEVLMCTEQWLKQDIKFESKILTNSEIFNEVEYEDSLEKEFEQLGVSNEEH